MKKILITGAGGYIGSVLTRYLLDRGYAVIAFDRFFFGQETLSQVRENPLLSIVKKDIRDIDPSDLEGVHAVCDLAALSNDPSGDLDPELTMGINHAGRVRVGRAAKRAGVARYVLSSSCSIYGHADGEPLHEAGPKKPLTTYARANLAAEEETLPLSDCGFCVTAIRFATVIEAPAERVSGEVFNIGKENTQVLSIAYIVREALPFPLQIEIAPDDP